MNHPTQAIVLAAGFGTRLRPLTNRRPKPILPVGGVPMILFNLALLQEFGIRDILINIHYFPQEIQKLLSPLSKQGFRLKFSLEKEILGTAGGIRKALKTMRRESTFVLNGDVVSDIDLNQMWQAHQKSKAQATLACIAPDQAKTSSFVEFDAQGKIHRIAGAPESQGIPLEHGIFTGFHLLEPGLFDYFPAKKFGCVVRNIYQPAIKEGKPMQSVKHAGSWWDLGSLEQLKEVDQKFWRGETSKKISELWNQVKNWPLGLH